MLIDNSCIKLSLIDCVAVWELNLWRLRTISLFDKVVSVIKLLVWID